MSITQEILSMDAYYRMTNGDKIILNDLSLFSITDLEEVNSKMMSVYNNTDVLSTIPSCDCGFYKGRYRLNKKCPECGSPVRETHDKTEPVLWLKTLDEKIRFINPAFWLVFKSALDNGYDWLRWLTDAKYNPPVEIPRHILGIKKDIMGDQRDYLVFCNNINKIITYLSNISKYKDHEKQVNLKLLKDLYNNNKNTIFSSYLPIINKKLFVVENTNKGRFINLSLSDIVDVVMDWIKVSGKEDMPLLNKASYTAATISKLASLYYQYFDTYVVKKIGAFRKHVYGSRSHFTFRSVISSIPTPHQHDEIHVPWGIGVTVFRPHILNKLLKTGMTYKEASRLLFRTVKKYEPIIHGILNELLHEAGGSITILAQRNPSLLQGSVQLCRITKFKTDTYDNTINISQLIMPAFNGDR